MESQHTESGAAPRKRPKRRRLVWGLVIAVAIVFIVVVFVVPAWLSSESGRRLILSRINDNVDGRVDAGTLSFGWFDGIRATEVTYNDAEGDTSFSVDKVTTRPKLAAILRGDLALGKTVLESPRVMLTVHESSVRNQSKEPARSESDRGVDLPLSALDLEVNDGNAQINLAYNGRTQTVEFRNIASNLDLSPRGGKSTFDVSMGVAEGNGAESQVSAAGSVTRPDKKWTFKGTSGTFRVKIDKLNLSTLAPLFALMGADVTAGGELNADADIEVDQGRFERIVAQANLRDFSQTVAGKKTVLEEPVTLEVDITSPDDVTQIKRFDVTSSFFTVRCTGTGESVDYDAKADLGKLQEVTRQFTDFGGYALQGNAASKGRLTIGKETVAVTGQGLAEQLVVRKGEVSTPVTSANVGFNIVKAPDVVRIPSLKIMADAGRLELRDSVVGIDKENAETRLNISADLDLAKLQPFVRLVADVPKDVAFGGRLTSEAAVTGKEGQMHVVSDKTNIAGLVITSPGQEAFKQDAVKITVDLIADMRQKEITINDLLVAGPEGEPLIDFIEGRVDTNEQQGKTSVTGRLEARYDLAAVTAMASPFLPGGLTMQGIRTTELTFNSQYPTGADRFLENLSGNTNLGFDAAQYVGLNIGPADLQVRADEGLMMLELPPTAVNNGQTQFTGNVNFREAPMTLRMAQPTQLVENVNINDEMSKRLLVYVNPLFANQAEVTGVANFYCEKLALPFGGDRLQEAMQITGTVQLDDVRLKPQGLLGQIGLTSPVILTIQPTRFILQDGIVSYKDMEAQVGEYPVNFSGQIGLDRKIDMNITFPWALTGQAVKVGDPTARITLPIEGTLDNPKINMSKAIEEYGRQRLEEELKKQEGELRERLERIFR